MCARTSCTWRCLLLFLSYFVYLLIGAAVFQALELKEESELKARVWRKKAQFLNSSSPSREALEKLVEAITEAIKHGVNPIGNESDSSHSNWDFSSSFFFAVTVVSTIGYGNISPTTPGGQIFCVFYALFGIPLHVIILTRVGKNLTSHTEKLRLYLSKKGMNEKQVKILTLLFFLIIGAVIFLALPPFVFYLFENWSYREGIYYAFITLSTIGFGDYVVGVDPHRKFHKFYRTSVAIWILFGIAWLALLFNLLSTFMEDTEKKIVEIKKKKKAAKEKMNFKYNANTNLSSEDVSILCSEKTVRKGAQESFEQQELSQVDLKIIASDHDEKETKPESLNAKISDQET